MSVIDEAKKALEGVTSGPWSLFNFRRGRILSVCIGAYANGQRPCIIDSGGFDSTDLKAKENVANARFIAWSREGVPALLAEIAAKDAEIARLRGEIIEATDENFIWGAMDNVHDADTTLADYAAAVSRAQRAALARVKGGEA